LLPAPHGREEKRRDEKRREEKRAPNSMIRLDVHTKKGIKQHFLIPLKKCELIEGQLIP